MVDTEQFKFQMAVAAAVAGKKDDLIALLLANHPMTALDKNALAYLLSDAHKRRRGAQPARLYSRTYYVRRAAEAVRKLAKGCVKVQVRIPKQADQLIQWLKMQNPTCTMNTIEDMVVVTMKGLPPVPVEQALTALAPWWPSHGYKLDPESEADMESVRNAIRRSRKPPKRRKKRSK